MKVYKKYLHVEMKCMIHQLVSGQKNTEICIRIID